MVAGAIVAARHYPGGFDWLYTVASALASEKHNPAGSTWFAGSLLLAMVLLWPYVSAAKHNRSLRLSATENSGFIALRTGLICGALLGLEKLLIRDLSSLVYKAHEILALLTFMGLYFGVLALLVQSMLRQKVYALPLLLVVAPLVAIAITQFWLYLDQRDLGWVDTSWRETGIPLWLSFAFWQWLAIGFLWLGLGLISFCNNE
ncbi:MAG: hypothetical protein JSW45_11830 [Thiotrichales bacterium]|nr:MAG: hypothetical protein JSW45_11830 [Thiotrichales bacterium]